jgi:DNA-binding GntR family transcriptional regulator
MAQIVTPAPEYRPLSADVYEALRDAILEGRLAAGERLVEAEIARQMTISRGPVREAIRKLEQDGLVQYLPRRGAVVVSLTPAEVRDAYYLRAHLEAYAVRLAVERATLRDLAALEGLIDRMHECAERDDRTSLLAADVEFHARLCELSGSKLVHRLWDSLNPHCWTVLTTLRATEYRLPEIAERHRPIVEAFRARDADQAEEAIRHHIIELADTVISHLTDEDRIE